MGLELITIHQELIHHLLIHYDNTVPVHDQVTTPPAAPTGDDGGPDFTHIKPSSAGVPKTGWIFIVAQVIMFFGLGVSFLMALGGIVGWVAGSVFGGQHISQQAKGHMLRAAIGGVALSAAGGLWTWITSI